MHPVEQRRLVGKHNLPRRARIVFYDVAREQLQTMSQPELARLDGVRGELSAAMRSLKNTATGWTGLPHGSSS
ncbi:hypothetical protein [Streptomyces sp. NBC_01361]|uniref:hypothetical protein n=1 Tax=Streptomyces sp. NBC_01361 TaxID=2903838 RepID=UPI002E2F34D6|nr:hypothetical protein [Streptomyces sp. NBC_01361]